MRTGEAVLVRKSTIGPLGETAGRVEHYRSTGEAVLVQQTTIGGLGRLS